MIPIFFLEEICWHAIKIANSSQSVTLTFLLSSSLLAPSNGNKGPDIDLGPNNTKSKMLTWKILEASNEKKKWLQLAIYALICITHLEGKITSELVLEGGMGEFSPIF